MALIKIKALRETISFYKVELEKEELTERERDKYLKALKIIEKIIKGKERSGEKEKHKEFIAYYHKAVFQDKEGNYQRPEGGE
ncbi:unnamed protein product [marine sediment metagenome]|uniref:Uncharacterized protein n=1 Tax=marine sediment metagenome TaxID=412755 RepID=X1QW19_9ZZZZ